MSNPSITTHKIDHAQQSLLTDDQKRLKELLAKSLTGVRKKLRNTIPVQYTNELEC